MYLTINKNKLINKPGIRIKIAPQRISMIPTIIR